MHVKSLQSCLILCDPVNWSPPVPLFMGFSRQEYWSRFPCPSPGDLPDPGIKPASFSSHPFDTSRGALSSLLQKVTMPDSS